ncbi:MAG TPA: sugar ABC transporter permease [Firmicutes bacterium]|nr:sugar ABC transporter permease [Bacillota bacterium]
MGSYRKGAVVVMKGKESRWLDLFFTVYILTIILPVLYVVTISFGSSSGMYTSSLIPKSFTLNNYIRLFTETDYPRWFLNSFLVSGSTVLISVLLISFSGYIFSRIDFYGQKKLLNFFMLLQIFPLTMSMVAVYKIMQALGLINSLSGLVILYIGMTTPFSIWLVKGYMDSIPRSIDESARIDGAGRLRIFFRFILPLSRPVLVVVAVNNFIASYSEYVLGNVLMTKQQNYTVAVGLRTFVEGRFGANWPVFTAGAVLSSIPALILFYLIQDWFVSGLVTGAMD